MNPRVEEPGRTAAGIVEVAQMEMEIRDPVRAGEIARFRRKGQGRTVTKTPPEYLPVIFGSWTR
jgi:hypothetical protein